jgi:drug/metabolite transporter (DMT)-like permease
MILVFLTGVLWSTAGLFIRLIEDAQVWQILLYRSIGLSLLLYVVIRVRSRADPFALVLRAGWPGLVAALGLIVAYAGIIYAIQTTTVANAMVLLASAPFLAAILGRLLLGESVRRATWIAILAGSAGIVVMVADKTAGTALSGNLAGFASALGFAVFTVALRWGRTVEMMPAVFLSGLLGIAMTVVICLATGLPLVLSLHDTAIATGMGVVQVGVGLVLYTIGSRSVPAAELVLLSLSEVVLGPLWVWLLLDEVPSTNTLIGGMILLAAIAGNALSGMRRKPPPPMI